MGLLPPNSPDFNPIDYMCGCNTSGILQSLLKAKDHSRAKKCTATHLGTGMTCRRQRSTAMNDFRKHVNACVSAGGGHFKHTMSSLYRNI